MMSPKTLTPWFAAVAIGASVAFAPVASAATTTSPATTTSAVVAAGTDPLVPYGTDPRASHRLGYVDSNHDEANTSAGEVDVPF